MVVKRKSQTVEYLENSWPYDETGENVRLAVLGTPYVGNLSGQVI